MDRQSPVVAGGDGERETNDKLGERPSGSVETVCGCARGFAGFKFNSQGAGAADGLRVDHSDNSLAGRRLPSPASFYLFRNEACRPAGRPKANYLLFIVDGGDKMAIEKKFLSSPN